MLCLDSLSLQLQLRSAPIHFDMTVTRIEVPCPLLVVAPPVRCSSQQTQVVRPSWTVVLTLFRNAFRKHTFPFRCPLHLLRSAACSRFLPRRLCAAAPQTLCICLVDSVPLPRRFCAAVPQTLALPRSFCGSTPQLLWLYPADVLCPAAVLCPADSSAAISSP